MAPPRLFISYAHEDHAWHDQLVEHLGGLRHQRGLVVWTDRAIKAGDEWNAEIQRELDDATVVVLILSSAFLNSKFCQKIELARAIERHNAGTARVIPVLARDCDWQVLPITSLECRPKNEKGDLEPLKSWPDADTPLAAIARKIREIIDPKGLAEAATPFDPHPLPERRHSFFVGRDEEKAALAERLAWAHLGETSSAIKNYLQQRVGTTETRHWLIEHAVSPEFAVVGHISGGFGCARSDKSLKLRGSAFGWRLF